MRALAKKSLSELVRYKGRRVDLRQLEERILRALPINDCALVLEQQERGEQQLVAFVSSQEPLPSGGAPFQDRLPADLRPDRWIELPSLSCGRRRFMIWRLS